MTRWQLTKWRRSFSLWSKKLVPSTERSLTGRNAAATAGLERDQDLSVTPRALTSAITDHAHRKHWAHTTLGVIAARRGNVAEARAHLRESAAVVGDHRLSSYGPSFLLARELCTLGEWNAVADYLEACAAFWNPEPLRGWVQQLREREMPEFFEQ